MKLVFRADDAGSSVGANLAIVETVRHGVVRNVSVMAPGPAFEHAVPLLSGLENINLGLHVTLSAEWDDPKWGPVSDPNQVPTLLENGVFTQNPGVLHERGFSVDEAMAEIRAQLLRLRLAGLRIDYVDEHMGVGWIRGLREPLREMCRTEGLVYAHDLPFSSESSHDEGPAVVVFHPGSDRDDVTAGFLHPGLEPGQIHAERIADRLKAIGPELRHHTSLTYREAAALLSDRA